MAELNIDLDFFEHPKTLQLVAELGEWAEILPIRLWRFAARFHAETGIITGRSLKQLELHLKWKGEKGKAIELLVEAGFLEPTESGYAVHDFVKRNGHIAALSKRAKHAAKSRWDKVNKPPDEPCPTDARAMLNDATSNALTGLTNETSEANETKGARPPPISTIPKASDAEKLSADIAQRFWWKQTGGKESEFKNAETVESMVRFGYPPQAIDAEVEKSNTDRDYGERFWQLKARIEKAFPKGKNGPIATRPGNIALTPEIAGRKIHRIVGKADDFDQTGAASPAKPIPGTGGSSERHS